MVKHSFEFPHKSGIINLVRFVLYIIASLFLAVELGSAWWHEQIFQQVIDFKRTPGIIFAGCYTENESPSIN